MLKPAVVLLSSVFALNAAQTVSLKTDEEKVSYSIGVRVGKDFKEQEIGVNPTAFFAGFKDGTASNPTVLTEAEMEDSLNKFQQSMMEKNAKKMAQLGEKNKKEGADFLAANKKKPGVVTLPSGLQYKVITPGTGASPKATDVVTTHYRGTLIDGTEFDSSYKRNEPTSFPVNGVIPGWVEALQLMKTGAKWELYIPSELAYGEYGPGSIGPNATLVFQVELLSIEKAAK